MRLERFQREEEALVARETGEVRHDDAFVPPPPIVLSRCGLVVVVFFFIFFPPFFKHREKSRQ